MVLSAVPDKLVNDPPGLKIKLPTELPRRLRCLRVGELFALRKDFVLAGEGVESVESK